jgi:hypothetical protein
MLPETAGVFELVSFMEINHHHLPNQCQPQLSLIQHSILLECHYKVINGYYCLDKIDYLEKDK